MVTTAGSFSAPLTNSCGDESRLGLESYGAGSGSAAGHGRANSGRFQTMPSPGFCTAPAKSRRSWVIPTNCGPTRLLQKHVRRQIAQRGLESELKILIGAQGDGVPIHAVTDGHGVGAPPVGQIKKNRGMQRLPRFRAARAPQHLQSLLLIGSKPERLPLGGEWHKPFSHTNVYIV
jgi:hypothetical protein